jgi:hypothetical protein
VSGVREGVLYVVKDAQREAETELAQNVNTLGRACASQSKSNLLVARSVLYDECLGVNVNVLGQCECLGSM